MWGPSPTAHHPPAYRWGLALSLALPLYALPGQAGLALGERTDTNQSEMPSVPFLGGPGSAHELSDLGFGGSPRP